MSQEEAQAFMAECEKKYADRYTDKEQEYARVKRNLDKGVEPPVIVPKPRQHGNHDDQRRSHYHQNSHHQRHYNRDRY